MCAAIRDDFRTQPRNTEVALDDTAILDCRGPRGEPDPRLSWRKDGELVEEEDGRVTVQDSGSLMLQNVRKTDTGIYVCRAENTAGIRDSDPARLLVLGKCVSVSDAVRVRTPGQSVVSFFPQLSCCCSVMLI